MFILQSSVVNSIKLSTFYCFLFLMARSSIIFIHWMPTLLISSKKVCYFVISKLITLRRLLILTKLTCLLSRRSIAFIG